MINCRELSIEDRPWIQEITGYENSRSADFCFSNMFIWDAEYRQHIARMGDRLIVRLLIHDDPYYAYPVGRGELEPVVLALLDDAKMHGTKLKISGVNPEHIALLEKAFPGKFAFEPYEYMFDYVYSVEQLAALPGKKYHAKRNHIARFIDNHPSWRFERVTSENLNDCVEISETWMTVHDTSTGERDSLSRSFKYFSELGIEGGILYSDALPVAFTLGEVLSSDTYVVHVEKALPDIQGAYPMITREFSRFIIAEHPQIIYVNREDDMGIDSLRKSKASFYPEFMVEKYTATWKDEPLKSV